MVAIPAAGSGASRRWPRVVAYVTIFLGVVFINAVAFSGALRSNAVLNAISSRFSIYAVDSPSQVSIFDHKHFSKYNGSHTNSWTGEGRETFYPVCILSTIGDDSHNPNDRALPYPLLYRLIDAGKDEIEHRLATTVDGGDGGRVNQTRLPLLVAVDFPTVVCEMARDSVQDAGLDSRGVDLTCKSMEQLQLRGGGSASRNDSNGIFCETAVVGKSKRYVPQLTVDLAQSISWKKLRVVDLDAQDASRGRPALPREDWRPTVVTSFSSNHFAVGLLLLRSLGRAGMEAAGAGRYNISVVVYTMETMNSTMQGILDCVIQELNENYHVPTELRAFDFDAHPEWMRVNQSMGREGLGMYAWKVVMIHEVLVERGFILWADAGCRYSVDSLIETLDYTKRFGFASRRSSGALPKYAHPGLIRYFRYPVKWGDDRVWNCDASGIGMTLDKYESIARPLYDCGLTRQCIAPDGATLDDHRYDQAALTLIVDMSGGSCQGLSSQVRRHMDYRPTDYSSTFPTECYRDPLGILE